MAQPENIPVSRSVTQLSRWGRKGRGQEGGLRKASAGAKGDSKGRPKKAAGEEDRQAAFGCMTPRRRLTCGKEMQSKKRYHGVFGFQTNGC